MSSSKNSSSLYSGKFPKFYRAKPTNSAFYDTKSVKSGYFPKRNELSTKLSNISAPFSVNSPRLDANRSLDASPSIGERDEYYCIGPSRSYYQLLSMGDSIPSPKINKERSERIVKQFGPLQKSPTELQKSVEHVTNSLSGLYIDEEQQEGFQFQKDNREFRYQQNSVVVKSKQPSKSIVVSFTDRIPRNLEKLPKRETSPNSPSIPVVNEKWEALSKRMELEEEDIFTGDIDDTLFPIFDVYEEREGSNVGGKNEVFKDMVNDGSDVYGAFTQHMFQENFLDHPQRSSSREVDGQDKKFEIGSNNEMKCFFSLSSAGYESLNPNNMPSVEFSSTSKKEQKESEKKEKKPKKERDLSHLFLTEEEEKEYRKKEEEKRKRNEEILEQFPNLEINSQFDDSDYFNGPKLKDIPLPSIKKKVRSPVIGGLRNEEFEDVGDDYIREIVEEESEEEKFERKAVEEEIVNVTKEPGKGIFYTCTPFHLNLKRYSLPEGRRKRRVLKKDENSSKTTSNNNSNSDDLVDMFSVLKYVPEKSDEGSFGHLKKERYRINFKSKKFCFYSTNFTYNFDLQNRIIKFDEFLVVRKRDIKGDRLDSRGNIPLEYEDFNFYSEDIEWDPLMRKDNHRKTKTGRLRKTWVIGKIQIILPFRVMVTPSEFQSVTVKFFIYQGLYPSKYRRCKTKPEIVSYTDGFDLMKFKPANEREERMIIVQFGSKKRRRTGETTRKEIRNFNIENKRHRKKRKIGKSERDESFLY